MKTDEYHRCWGESEVMLTGVRCLLRQAVPSDRICFCPLGNREQEKNYYTKIQQPSYELLH